MKKTAILLPLLAAAIVSCNSGGEKTTTTTDSATATTVTAPEPPKAETPAPPMDSATKMKMWMESMTPGAMHKMMAESDGNWTEETTMWEHEGAQPMMGKATCVNKMILGGRYQESRHKGDMMGMPFEGISTTAYDNSRKVFISTWVDNMGTGVMYLEGTYDEASKTMTMKGKCTDPTNGKDMEVRELMKYTDDKHQVMEMYQTPAGGKEYKAMEIKFTKK